MKTPLITWLLGVTVTLTSPSLVWAHKDHKSNQGKQHTHKHHAKHWKQQKHHAKHPIKQGHPVRNHHYYQDSNPRTSFSIHWNNGGPQFVFDNRDRSHHKWRKQKRFMNEVYARQNRQRHRIRKGVDKGQLVHWEARKLRREQRRIADKIHQFRSDGWINRHERHRITQLQDNASNHIRRKKHNNITRYQNPRRNTHRNHSYDYVYYH